MSITDLEPAALEAARKEYNASLDDNHFGATERVIRAYLSAVDRSTHLTDWLNDGWTHCQHGTREWCEAYLHNARAVIEAQNAALAARSAPEAGKAVVKPLVWVFKNTVDGCFTAESIVGRYTVFGSNGSWHWSNGWKGHSLGAHLPSAESAKAAAQADYEQRILSCLASVAPSGAEPAYWAIHSKSGSHIGLWKNEDIARDILREYEGGTITPLYASPQAVPAEDVANLITSTEAELAAGSASAMDWNTRSIALVRRLLAALTSLSAERDRAKMLVEVYAEEQQKQLADWKAEGWRDMSSAPKEEGRRILAWCKAAESDHGIVEIIWTGTCWGLVVDHPWPNACLNPRYWRNSPAAPLPEDTREDKP